MLDFLKDRVLLFMLILGGDYISLAGLIKAKEIKTDAVTTAIVVTLLPTLIISLVVKYLCKTQKKSLLVKISIFISVLLWSGFVISLLNFNSFNNRFGKVPFPITNSSKMLLDSFIVGGCTYTPEAQKEVEYFNADKRTLTPQQLLADFNYNVSSIWTEKEIDCARTKILKWFASLLFFLMTGITLLCELLLFPNSKEK